MPTPEEARAELARRELARRQTGRDANASAAFAENTLGLALAPVPFLNVVPALRAAAANPSDRVGAGAAGYLDSSGLGWNDEATGGFAAIGDVMRGIRPTAQRMQAATNTTRQNLDTAYRENPLSTIAGQIVGFVAPGMATGGGSTAAQGVGTRFGIAAGTGGALGAVSGAGSAGRDEDRLQGAAMGGLLGAATGAAFQGANEARLFERGGDLLRRGLGLPPSAPNPQRGLAGMANGLGENEQALDDLVRTARRNRNLGVRTPNDLGRVMDEAAQIDPQMTVAEALQTPGQGRLAYLARAPGETGQLVEDVFTQRALNQSSQLENAFLGRAPATGDALEQTVEEAWRTRGRELYEPLMGNVSPAGQAAFNGRILPRITQGSERYSPVIAEAWDRAGRMIQEEVSLGALPANAANNLARRLHFTKMALDDMVRDPTTVPRGLRAVNNAQLSRIASDFADTLDNGSPAAIIPGYRTARTELADYATAQRAIEAGRGAFGRQRFPSPEALARHVQNLSPGERPYFIAGVEEALANTIRTAGRDGRRNAAASLLSDQTQARLRAVFGQEADGMIDRARQLARQFEFGQRVRPTTGSITSQMAFEAADTASIPTTARGAAFNLAQRAYFGIAGPAGERYRNRMGQVYTTPVGRFQQEGGGLLARARREAEQRRLAQRTLLTNSAVPSGFNAMGISAFPQEDQYGP